MIPTVSKVLILLLLVSGCTGLRVTPLEPSTADFAVAPHVWSSYLQSSGMTQEASDVAWWARFNDPTLLTLIEAAMHTNLDLVVAKERVRQARALSQRDAVGLKPRVDLNASVIEQRQSETSVLPVGRIPGFESDNVIYRAGFDASWELDFFGRGNVINDISEARISSAEEASRDVALSVIAEIARHYVSLRSAQSEITLIGENAERQKAIAELTRTKRDYGEASDLDVERVELAQAGYAAQLPNLSAQIRLAKIRLAVLTGEPPSLDLSALDARRPLADPPAVLAVGLTSDLLRRRPDVRGAERHYVMKARQADLAAIAAYPRFSLFASGGPETTKLSDLFDADSLALTLGALLNWSLFDGGQQEADQALAVSALRMAESAYRKAVLRALEDVEIAAAQYVAQSDTAKDRRKIVRSAKRLADMSQIRFEAGSGTLLDVLTAQRELADSKLQLSQTTAMQFTHLIALYKALGGGWRDSETARVP